MEKEEFGECCEHTSRNSNQKYSFPTNQVPRYLISLFFLVRRRKFFFGKYFFNKKFLIFKNFKDSSDLWSGVVTGKYKINNTPLLKRPTNTYKPQTSQQALNDQHPPKLIRSQTLVENCSRRFSNSSNDSSSTSSSIGKKTTNSQYNGNNVVHGTSNSYKHRPQLSSGSGGSKILRRKDNLTSIGRGKLAVIRGETNFDLEKNNKEVEANSIPSKTKKPIFY
jgi:hypothetical protein